jgi:hypothetical protein
MAIGQQLGSLLGSAGGGAIGSFFGSPTLGASVGGLLGGELGRMTGFKKGGRVKRTGKALVHKGEFVLPVGVAPTKAQKKAVKKRGGKM